MDPTPPEINTVEVFLTLISKQIPNVLADERWCVVAACLETVDHRRRSGEQVLDAIAGRSGFFFRSLALGDVAPRADHFDRLAVFIPNQALLVAHPTVGAVLPEKSVLDRVAAFLEQLDGLGLNRGEIVGMHAAAPKIRAFQILPWLVAEPVPDVL